MPTDVGPGLPLVRGIRWTGTLAVIGGFLAIAGIVANSFGLFGAQGLADALVSALPWMVVVTLGFLVRFLSGQRAAAASVGLAVFASLYVGPTAIAALVRIRWLREPSLWPTPAFTSPDLPAETSVILVSAGSAILIAGTILVAASAWVPIARLATVRGGSIPRSAYRIEALTILFVFILVATATVSSFQGGAYPTFARVALFLSWLVPLIVVLSLALRSNGMGSLWAVAALTIAFILEPLVRMIIEGIVDSLDLRNSPEGWIQAGTWVPGSGFTPILSSPWLIVVVLALLAVVALWNAQPSLVTGSQRGPVSPTAPLEPWAGVAFILAFIPLISIPAVVLGHLAYERITASDRPLRGRILAATAIVLGLLNIALPILFVTETLSALSDLWSGV